MSLNNFIPELWSDTILAARRKSLVAAALCNKDYQGQINQMGDVVRINSIGDITVSNFTKDTDLNPPQALSDAQTMLVISQAKYYNFEIDDVDAAQQHPKVMTEAMSWSAYRIADQIDQFVLGFYTDAPAGSSVGTSASPVVPVAPTQTNVGTGMTVYDYLVQLGQFQTQNLTPQQGRWCVVPPWAATYLAMDIRFTSFNTAQANQRLAAGTLDTDPGEAYLGRIAGMDLYQSVNAAHLGGTSGIAGSQDVVLAGHAMALTFAQGLDKVEAYRPPLRFADAVKGLALYGAKTVRPQMLAAAFLQHP